MANILTYPDALSLASNLKKFVISSVEDIRFKLYCGATLIIDESYSPASDGKITIDVKEVVKNELSFIIPTADVFLQTGICKEFVAHIDLETKTFLAIRAGVENLAVSATEFLTQNFLTWQPQSKSVGYLQPEWLTYYAPVAGNLKVKFYLKDTTSPVQTLAALVAGSCTSVNMMFSRIMALQAGEKYGYFDVWFENAAAARLTYIQRYIYNETEAVDEHFLFENSLGGIDTAVMSGESVFTPELTHTEGVYEEEREQLDDTVSRLFQKSTGWKSKVEAAWLWDFFRAIRKYKIDSGVIRKITIKESEVKDSTNEDMKSFSFTYRIASDKGLLNIPRSADPLPSNLEITTPEGLFFLAPRLVEFPSYSEDDGLIPIQSPYIQSWFKISKTQLKSEIKQLIMIDPAFSQYVLPKASDTVLGGIKVGSNLTIDPDGTLHAQNSYSLPVATIASLGGVMIGSNISVSAQGVISVAAPYVHPDSHPASMIVSDTLRRFITDTQISNYDAAYNARHTHGNKSSLDTINQDLSKTSNVQFNNIIADGSIAFYGDVGSGSVPVGSLLDLSDIDPSLATAITGSPLVKLASGKWGPGSISIDLSNYFNKTDSDSRFAFKSHSHDYISPTTFNGHTGDLVKHLTAAERTAWNGKEPALGNPDVDGKILSSSGGVRSWVNRYVLPVAAAAMLGGVMIGSNISVNGQGVISVAAPYSHPASHAASMIDTDATRRFISDAQLSNLADAYNLRHTHGNKANLDSINQDLSKTSNVQFNNLIADGSIGFYGGVGSGGTPVASLLDLSDIDASISTAATGTPLVKLINGKWGAGSISIDLSNYYNKTDSDTRYAFKSHSHDYISPTTFNGHTGRTDNPHAVTFSQLGGKPTTLSGYGITNGVTKNNVLSTGADLNSLSTEAFYYLNGIDGANSPTGYNQGNVLHLTFNSSTTYNAQLYAAASGSNHIFFRKQNGSVWLGWAELYHSDNIATIKTALGLGTNAYNSTAYALLAGSTSQNFSANRLTLSENLYFDGGTNKVIKMYSATNWWYALKTINADFSIVDADAYEFLRFYYNGGTKYTKIGNVSITGGAIAMNGALTGVTTGAFSSAIQATSGIFTNGYVSISQGSGTAYSSRISTVYEYPFVDTYIDSIAGAGYEGRLRFRTSSSGGTLSDKLIIYNSGAAQFNSSVYSSSYIESASYLKGLSVKLGTWEIKENASGELEFIQSGYLRFKGTSLGLISQKTVAFYD